MARSDCRGRLAVPESIVGAVGRAFVWRFKVRGLLWPPSVDVPSAVLETRAGTHVIAQNELESLLTSGMVEDVTDGGGSDG